MAWHVLVEEREVIMSTSNLITESTGLAVCEWKEPALANAEISLCRSVNADRQRLFQALTVCEYIEAWFSPPDALAGTTSVFITPGAFSISYRELRGTWCRFYCSYTALRRSKIQFTWSDGQPERDASSVRIRLQGDFERTTVLLNHAGLRPSEYFWHRSLWEQSLERLSKLF